MSSTAKLPSSSAPAAFETTPVATKRQLTIALAGNPNAGKTTLFNALTGLRQKVANYPGVTVERKEGHWQPSGAPQSLRIIDLPGLYSLDAASIDEQIARDVITGAIAGLPAPDVIVAVVDATNLRRNLYLVTQIMEYGLPLVVALTMVDLAKRKDLVIDARQLEADLGVPVIPVIATKRDGINELANAVLTAVGTANSGTHWKLSEAAENELSTLAGDDHSVSRHKALRRLYSDNPSTPL